MKKRKLRWAGHISRLLGLAKMGKLKGKIRGGQRKRLVHDMKVWMGTKIACPTRASEDNDDDDDDELNSNDASTHWVIYV